jgi:hypothetical protein
MLAGPRVCAAAARCRRKTSQQICWRKTRQRPRCRESAVWVSVVPTWLCRSADIQPKRFSAPSIGRSLRSPQCPAGFAAPSIKFPLPRKIFPDTRLAAVLLRDGRGSDVSHL